MFLFFSGSQYHVRWLLGSCLACAPHKAIFSCLKQDSFFLGLLGCCSLNKFLGLLLTVFNWSGAQQVELGRPGIH